MRFLVAIGLTASAVAAGGAPAAAAEGIEVAPATAAPGEPVTLRSSCEGPAERLEFTSPAFQGSASAELADTFGTVPVVVAPGTQPGVYGITGECAGGGSTETVTGEVTVVHGPLTPTPFGPPQTGGGGAAPVAAGGPVPAALAGAGLLAAGAVAAAAARRRRAARAG